MKVKDARIIRTSQVCIGVCNVTEGIGALQAHAYKKLVIAEWMFEYRL